MNELYDICRTYGEARLAIAEQAKSAEDWHRLWYPAKNEYPFTWGPCWKGCIEYSVVDYSAEIGFWLDLVGLDSNVLSADFTMLMSPDQAFYFAVVPAADAGPTPAGAIRIQFMLADIASSVQHLADRGVAFERTAEPDAPGSSLLHAVLRTPAGIAVDLWGMARDTGVQD